MKQIKRQKSAGTKPRPRTSGTTPSMVTVLSREFPKPPDSVRLSRPQKKEAMRLNETVQSDGSNGPPTFRPSTASTGHPFHMKKALPTAEEIYTAPVNPKKRDASPGRDGPGSAYFPDNEDPFPPPDENSEASRQMHREIQAQALKCIQISESSSGSSLHDDSANLEIREIDFVPKSSARAKSVIIASEPPPPQRHSSRRAGKPIDWERRGSN